jgi:hypothetical protein
MKLHALPHEVLVRLIEIEDHAGRLSAAADECEASMFRARDPST